MSSASDDSVIYIEGNSSSFDEEFGFEEDSIEGAGVHQVENEKDSESSDSDGDNNSKSNSDTSDSSEDEDSDSSESDSKSSEARETDGGDNSSSDSGSDSDDEQEKSSAEEMDSNPEVDQIVESLNENYLSFDFEDSYENPPISNRSNSRATTVERSSQGSPYTPLFNDLADLATQEILIQETQKILPTETKPKGYEKIVSESLDDCYWSSPENPVGTRRNNRKRPNFKVTHKGNVIPTGDGPAGLDASYETAVVIDSNLSRSVPARAEEMNMDPDWMFQRRVSDLVKRYETRVTAAERKLTAQIDIKKKLRLETQLPEVDYGSYKNVPTSGMRMKLRDCAQDFRKIQREQSRTRNLTEMLMIFLVALESSILLCQLLVGIMY